MLSTDALPDSSTRVVNRPTAPSLSTRPALWSSASVLPAAVSSFIGREGELEDIGHLLSTNRLVTLTGPGGCGKTRLAVEVARRWSDGVVGTAVFVPLGPLRDPGFVAQAVGRALGLWEVPRRSYRQTVAEAIGDRALLLVLDNFEHLLAAAPLVGEWLAACPGLTVLATSRERLRLQGERVHAVPPLTVAPPRTEPAHRGPSHGLDVSSAYAGSEAARLFVERARAVQADFALSDETGPLVDEICRRLDGLPLAIELAAVQLRFVPPALLLDRLDRRLPLLTRGPRDAPARQQTLRDTIAWSHDLLDASERRLLRRLAVLVGEWTLEAAEAVAGNAPVDGAAASPDACRSDDDPDTDPRSTLELLASLVDKSLIERVDALVVGPRFRMLETIREYALGQLVASGDDERSRRRHAAYHLALAEAAAPRLTGKDQALVMACLTGAHADIRAALQWHLDRRDAESAASLLWPLVVFWWARGHIAEARQWAERILACPALSALAEARAGCVAGLAMFKQGAYAEAASLLNRARLPLREHGDVQGGARATLLLGHVTAKIGSLERARLLLAEARADFEGLGDWWGAGLASLGLGVLLLMAGNRAEARRIYAEYLAMARAASDVRSIGQGLDGLALVALWDGDHDLAATLLTESVPACLEAGHVEFLAYGLGGLACVAAARRQPVRAGRLLGAAHRLLAQQGVDAWPMRRDLFLKAQEQARSLIGDERYETAHAEGERLLMEDAARYALVDEPPPTSAELAPGGQTEGRAPGGLTAREVEVVRLVAAGMTNREIAAAMTVSGRTVGAHLDHIFSKLDVSTRTAVATFALRNGLA